MYMFGFGRGQEGGMRAPQEREARKDVPPVELSKSTRLARMLALGLTVSGCQRGSLDNAQYGVPENLAASAQDFQEDQDIRNSEIPPSLKQPTEQEFKDAKDAERIEAHRVTLEKMGEMSLNVAEIGRAPEIVDRAWVEAEWQALLSVEYPDMTGLSEEDANKVYEKFSGVMDPLFDAYQLALGTSLVDEDTKGGKLEFARRRLDIVFRASANDGPISLEEIQSQANNVRITSSMMTVENRLGEKDVQRVLSITDAATDAAWEGVPYRVQELAQVRLSFDRNIPQLEWTFGDTLTDGGFIWSSDSRVNQYLLICEDNPAEAGDIIRGVLPTIALEGIEHAAQLRNEAPVQHRVVE